MALQLSLQLYGQLDLINYANNMAEVDSKLKNLGDRLIFSGTPENIVRGGILRGWKNNVPPEILWADIPPIEKVDIILRDYIN